MLDGVLIILMITGMYNIMEADIEQISQLMQFAEAMLEYHKQCSEVTKVFIENDVFSDPDQAGAELDGHPVLQVQDSQLQAEERIHS